MNEASEVPIGPIPDTVAEPATPLPEAEQAAPPTIASIEKGAGIVGKSIANRLVKEIASQDLASLNTDAERAINILFTKKAETESGGPEPISYVDPKNPNGLEINGNPVVVEINGQQVQVMSLRGQINKSGVAMAQIELRPEGLSTAATSYGEVSWDALIQAQIIAEQIELGQRLPEEEGVLFEYHVAQIAGGDEAEAAKGRLFADDKLDSTRKTVEATAQRRGIFTRDTIEAYLNSPAGKILPPEQQQRIRERIGEEIVVGGDIVAEVLTGNSDITTENVGSAVKETEENALALSGELREVESKLQASPTGPEADALKQQQAELVAKQQTLVNEHARLQQLQEVATLTKDGDLGEAIRQYCQAVENGEVPEDVAKGIEQAFRSGNMNNVLDKMVANGQRQKDAGETEEQAADRQEKTKKIDELRKKGENFGFLALLAIAAVSIASAEVMKK